MTQKELGLSFIEKLNNHQYDVLYKFFTRDTKVYLISDDKEISCGEFVDAISKYLDTHFEIIRELESKICFKVETMINKQQVNFFFDVKSRRIVRLEIEVI